MPIEIIGETTVIHRTITGFYTFDIAFAGRKGEIGFPVKALLEVYGPSGIGKSTFTYWLASKIAMDLKGNITLADTETMDTSYMKDLMENAGFDGKVKFAEGEKDADLIDNLVTILKSEDYVVGILDSLGAVSPVAEEESSSEAASMGARAKVAARMSRKAIFTFRKKKSPSIIIFTNHMLPVIGFGHGVVTSGGKVKEFLSGTQIKLSRKEETDEGYVLFGKVTKNRFGYYKRNFLVYSLAGYGINHNLTAVKECIAFGLAEDKRGIRIGDKKFGYFSRMLDKLDDDEFFQPFHVALATSSNKSIQTKSTNDDDDEEDE